MRRTVYRALLPVALGACAEGELPGHYYDIAVQSTQDECNEPDEDYREAFVYRVVLDGSSASIFLDDAVLATGVLSGCELTYQSTLLTDQRDEFVVRWRLSGRATISTGGTCDGAGDGWVGEERIDVTESNDPDVARGCSFYMDVTGAYEGLVE